MDGRSVGTRRRRGALGGGGRAAPRSARRMLCAIHARALWWGAGVPDNNPFPVYHRRPREFNGRGSANGGFGGAGGSQPLWKRLIIPPALPFSSQRRRASRAASAHLEEALVALEERHRLQQLVPRLLRLLHPPRLLQRAQHLLAAAVASAELRRHHADGARRDVVGGVHRGVSGRDDRHHVRPGRGERRGHPAVL